ncbi:phosphorylase [Sphingomonas sp.]|uniref:phosphorylase family protein n=1 Tax=Sphingomonas sp. TaxID=28214 RepID=UPI0025DC0FEB|nr:phosphorylase [Sphingomonas sp.]
MSHVIAATGFNREAALIRQPGVVTVAGGGDAAGLAIALDAAAVGAIGIISFGLTGALADGLAIGDWVVGDRIAGGFDLACDPAWRDALVARLPAARIGGFFADGRMIDTVAEKRALGTKHGALAVDMESHVAARIAAAHGLPFTILRCISDGVDHLLPHAITVCMKPDGTMDGAAMLRSLAARPTQIPDFTRTMAGFAKAFRALGHGAALVGPRMGFPGAI